MKWRSEKRAESTDAPPTFGGRSTLGECPGSLEGEELRVIAFAWWPRAAAFTAVRSPGESSDICSVQNKRTNGHTGRPFSSTSSSKMYETTREAASSTLFAVSPTFRIFAEHRCRSSNEKEPKSNTSCTLELTQRRGKVYADTSPWLAPARWSLVVAS